MLIAIMSPSLKVLLEVKSNLNAVSSAVIFTVTVALAGELGTSTPVEDLWKPTIVDPPDSYILQKTWSKKQ